MVPGNASAAGYHEHRDATGLIVHLDAVLDDLSAAGYEAQERFYRDWGGRFAATQKRRLGPREAADWQSIDDRSSSKVAVEENEGNIDLIDRSDDMSETNAAPMGPRMATVDAGFEFAVKLANRDRSLWKIRQTCIRCRSGRPARLE